MLDNRSLQADWLLHRCEACRNKCSSVYVSVLSSWSGVLHRVYFEMFVNSCSVYCELWWILRIHEEKSNAHCKAVTLYTYIQIVLWTRWEIYLAWLCRLVLPLGPQSSVLHLLLASTCISILVAIHLWKRAHSHPQLHVFAIAVLTLDSVSALILITLFFFPFIWTFVTISFSIPEIAEVFCWKYLVEY